MGVVITYLCFIVAGFAAGGAWSTFKADNKLFAGVLLALTVLAVVAGVVRLL